MNPDAEMLDAAEAAWAAVTYQRTSRRAMAAAIAAAVDQLTAVDGWVLCRCWSDDGEWEPTPHEDGRCWDQVEWRDCPGRHRRLLYGPPVLPEEDNR